MNETVRKALEAAKKLEENPPPTIEEIEDTYKRGLKYIDKLQKILDESTAETLRIPKKEAEMSAAKKSTNCKTKKSTKKIIRKSSKSTGKTKSVNRES